MYIICNNECYIVLFFNKLLKYLDINNKFFLYKNWDIRTVIDITAIFLTLIN